jgi:hypothetical protein
MPTVTIRLIDVKGSNVSRRCQYGESVAYESDNRRRTHTRRLACAGALLLVCSSIRTADPDGFESAFDVKRADFASVGKNDYFILDQGISLSSKVKRAKAARLVNEDGFAEPAHVSAEELPLVLNRIADIDQYAPFVMDQVPRTPSPKPTRPSSTSPTGFCADQAPRADMITCGRCGSGCNAVPAIPP